MKFRQASSSVVFGSVFSSESRLRFLILLLVMVTLTTLVIAEDESWPQFRGPGSLGISQTKNLPVTWSDTENLSWKTALPGSGSSSPIALDGKIYVTGENGYIVVLRQSGELDVLGKNDMGESCIATPAIADGRLYVRTLTKLYCISEDAQ